MSRGGRSAAIRFAHDPRYENSTHTAALGSGAGGVIRATIEQIACVLLVAVVIVGALYVFALLTLPGVPPPSAFV